MSEGFQGLQVIHRNPGHWDIVDRNGRAFRIRGEPGNVIVTDERSDENKYGRFPRPWIQFRTVRDAMNFILDQMMFEEGHP